MPTGTEIVIVAEPEVEVVEVGIAGAQGALGLLETDQDGNVIVLPTGRLNFLGPGLAVELGIGQSAEVSLDLASVDAGGELEGTLDAPTVAASHSGSSHQSIIDTEHAHEIDNVGAHAASAVAFTPTSSIAAADAQSAIVEALTDSEAHADTADAAHVIASDPHGDRAAAAGGLAGHVTDATDAHDASAVSVVPFGSIAATDVQAALEEVIAEASASHPNLAVHDALGLATDAELATHAGAADPHPVYETSAEAAAKVTAHEAASDPHAGYQKENEKGAASGYASLDGAGTVPDAQLPAGLARDSEVSSAVSAHEGAGDPHPTYETSAEAAAKVTAHEAASDPHTGYQKESEKAAASGYASLDAGTKVPIAQLPTGTSSSTVALGDAAAALDATHAADTTAVHGIPDFALVHAWKVFDAERDFGIVGDGAGDGLTGTDNYGAIQSLVSAMNARGRNCRVIYPKGYILVAQYKITGGGGANGITGFILNGIDGLEMDCRGAVFDMFGAFNRADDGSGVSYSNGIEWRWQDCSEVLIHGGEWDFNVDQMTKGSVSETAKAGLGGYGLYLQGVSRFAMEQSFVHHASVDNLYVAPSPSGTPRQISEGLRFTDVDLAASARNNLTLAGCKDMEYEGGNISHAGHTDAAGTAVGGYGAHAPKAGIDHEGTLSPGSGSGRQSGFSDTTMFRRTNVLLNDGPGITGSHEFDTRNLSFEDCVVDLTGCTATNGIELGIKNAQLRRCTIIDPEGADVFLSGTPTVHSLAGASWAANVITFDTGGSNDRMHGLDPGDICTVASSNPSGYNGDWRVLATPTPYTWTAYSTSDPGTYVGSGTYRQPVSHLMEDCKVYAAGSGVASRTIVNPSEDLKLRRNKLYFTGTGVMTHSFPLIQFCCSEYTENEVFLPATAHDGTTGHQASRVENVGLVGGNRYKTNLADRGDSSLFFYASYAGSTVFHDEFVSGQSFRPSLTDATPSDGVWPIPAAGTDVVSPAQITANQNNYAPSGLSTAAVLRLSTDASRNITGIAAQADRRELLIANVGAFDIVLMHDATSTAANRFYCPNDVDFTLAKDSAVRVIYDAASSRWRVQARPVSSSGAPTTVDYLVGTADAGLSAEIVVGTSPGGELGGTWASPTVDATHSGSAHHDPVTVGTGLDVTGQLVELDLFEVSAGGELGGTMDAPTVDATHSGSTHGAATTTHEASSHHVAVPLSVGGVLLSPAGAINVITWYAPFACTVTNVRGYRVGGTGATINARKNGSSNHLASALSLTSADAWMDGGTVQNTSLAAGDKLEIMVASVAGAPTQIAIQVDLTRTV